MDVQGKVALVTGGGSGIGRAVALRLATEGARVAVLDRDEIGARGTADAIRAAGGNALAIAADVTDEESLTAAFNQAQIELGSLDIVVNNAGVVTGQPPFPEAPASQWKRTLDVNLFAVILGTQLAVERMGERGGAIINTASLAGIMGFPPDPAYAASKGGVVLFTRSLAPLKESHGIRVNCVCPGFVDTPMLHGYSGDATPERRAILDQLPKLQPDDIADAMLGLITDDNAAGQAVQTAAGMPRVAIPAPGLESLFTPAG